MNQTQNVAQRTRQCIVSLFSHDLHTNPFSMPSETLHRDQRLYVHGDSEWQEVKWDIAWEPPRRRTCILKYIHTYSQTVKKMGTSSETHTVGTLLYPWHLYHSSCISMFPFFKRCCSVYSIRVTDGSGPLVTCHLSSPCPQHRRNEVDTHQGLLIVPGHQEVLRTESVAIAAITLNKNRSSPSSLGPHPAYLG